MPSVRVSFAVAAIGLSLAAVAHAEPRIITPDEVRPGMKGYALTVFEGLAPERFDITVAGVLHNFLPREDVILVRSEDPRLVHSGIVAGMSGSPVYIEGRLAGALAYGWHFSKDAVGGVTPIANMLAEGKRPLRGREHTPSSEAMNDRDLFGPHRSVDEALAQYQKDTRAHSGTWSPMVTSPLPPLPPDFTAGSQLVRASVPLAIAGLGAQAFDALGTALAPYHMVPLAAGGTAKPGRHGPDHFEEGGSIAVKLIDGDISATGTGTVTYVDGKQVLAFGHPLFQLGELYLPIGGADIHGFMSGVQQSFKFSTPTDTLGTLVQDRQSCIVGVTGEMAASRGTVTANADREDMSDMIPIRVRIGGPGREERVVEARVARHRFLTPTLAATVITSAAQEAAPDVADAVVTLRTTLKVRGQAPIELVDHAFSPEGVSARVFGSATGVRAINEILFNQFAPANLDGIDVQVDVDYRPDVAEIVGASLRSDDVEPGTRCSLTVTLRPYNGVEYTQSVPLDIPRALAGASLKIEAAAGNLVKPDIAPPENFKELLANLGRTFPSRAIVVTVQTPDEGLMLRGNVVPELPASVLDTLRPGASSRRGEAYKIAARIVVPMRGVVAGKKELTVKVKELPSR